MQGKKPFITLIALSFLGFFSLPAANSVIPVSGYGTILTQLTDLIPGATVEKIMLYPQETEGSIKKIERHALLVRYKDAVGTILMCHGFMCDKYDQGFLRNLFPKGRYNLMTFDFRAHGEKTEGQCCTLGRDEALDVMTAAHFLRNHPEMLGKPLFAYGFSMGAVAAIEAQAKDATLFNAMILDCPFDSSENILKRSLENVTFTLFGYQFKLPGRSLLQKYAFHPYVQALVKVVLKTITKLDPRNVNTFVHPVTPVKSVEKVTVPSLFILCKKDDKVSVEAMRNIFNASGASFKKLWLTNGRGHFDSYFYSPERYTQEVHRFLEMLENPVKIVPSKEIVEDTDNDALMRGGV